MGFDADTSVEIVRPAQPLFGQSPDHRISQREISRFKVFFPKYRGHPSCLCQIIRRSEDIMGFVVECFSIDPDAFDAMLVIEQHAGSCQRFPALFGEKSDQRDRKSVV